MHSKQKFEILHRVLLLKITKTNKYSGLSLINLKLMKAFHFKQNKTIMFAVEF